MNNDVVIIDKEKIQDKIYIIRGQKVMLDRDLALIYGYETRYFNRQVKNNIEKFDNDFMFQLTKNEFDGLKCKNFTSNWGGVRKLPFAFTEQGIYMLMTVLKGEMVYHCGASSKDSGKRINTITEIKDIKQYYELIDNILNNQELILK